MSRVDAQSKRSAGDADDVEVLRRVYAEWGRGNFRPRPDVYANDMEWGWSEEFPGPERVSHDPDLRSSRLREFLVDTCGAHLWTMRDGKAVRLEVFSSQRRALEVTGHEPGNPQRKEAEQWHSRS